MSAKQKRFKPSQRRRAAAGWGPVVIDEHTRREMRAALDELHRQYGYPVKDAA